MFSTCCHYNKTLLIKTKRMRVLPSQNLKLVTMRNIKFREFKMVQSMSGNWKTTLEEATPGSCEKVT